MYPSVFEVGDVIQIELEHYPTNSSAKTRLMVGINPIEFVWNSTWMKEITNFIVVNEVQHRVWKDDSMTNNASWSEQGQIRLVNALTTQQLTMDISIRVCSYCLDVYYMFCLFTFRYRIQYF